MNPGTRQFLRSARAFVCAGNIDPAEPNPGQPGVTNRANLEVVPGGEAAVTGGLQQAIETVAGKTAGPAGRVLYFPSGVYITGTRFMGDAARLHFP